jgi:hypothetical protein
LSSFYPSIEIYTQQLRALEQYVRDHRTAPDARFLLAYHYLACGYTDPATMELSEVVKLNPKDQLSVQLLHSLQAPAEAIPPAPQVPAEPVAAAALVGTWKAVRGDEAPITLDLFRGGSFTWSYGRGDKAQRFSGDYSVAENLLILKQGGQAKMVGQLTQLAPERFNFKVAGSAGTDPGLTFSREEPR